METNYQHTVLILKNGVTQIESNSDKKPDIEEYKNPSLDMNHRWVFNINNTNYQSNLDKWQSNTKYFPFSSELDCIRTESTIEGLIKEADLINGIPVTCIKIKEGLAYFKNPVLGVDFEFSIDDNGMIEEIPIINESQYEMWEEIKNIIITETSRERLGLCKQRFKITRIK